jgi:hypothetical protein
MTAKLFLLVLLFGKLSLFAVGGVNSTVPEIAQQVVSVHHWTTAAQFSQLFALAQSAPGPNMLIAALIGAHVAGLAGGLIATLAMILPAGILVMAVSRLWDRFREQRWRLVLQARRRPLAPVRHHHDRRSRPYLPHPAAPPMAAGRRRHPGSGICLTLPPFIQLDPLKERAHGISNPQTRQPGTGSIRHRPWLHGHEPVLRTGRRGGIHRHPASRHRTWLHLPRHRRSLRPF